MPRESNPAAGPERLREQVEKCRKHPAILQELEDIYRSADADIAQADLTCFGGGGCCRFDLAGHRLYVSTAELALLLERIDEPVGATQPMRCPYQIGPRCSARDWRPLGCRLYFCAAGAGELSARVYERYHGQIRDLHSRHCLEYLYTELTASLGEILRPQKAVDITHQGT